MVTFEERDQAYQEFRKQNPNATFAEFHAGRVLKRLADGYRTEMLGSKLLKFEDWWDAGAEQFDTYRNRYGIKPGMRVVDYGCGTLRMGAHFVRFLGRGNYFGLDVVADYLEIARQNLGKPLMRKKAPRLGVISDNRAMADAASFRADFVYSSAVCQHVHPDEAGAYFANLLRLTAKPGAVLSFDMTIADRPVRRCNLALPLERYIAALKPLEFVTLHPSLETEEDGVKIVVGSLEFRRPKS